MNRTDQNAETPVIYAYTRKQALADGEQVDVTAWAKEEGFRYPVYMTRSAWAATIEAGGRWIDRADGEGQDLVLPAGQHARGRAHDLLWMLLCAIRSKAAGFCGRLAFRMLVRAHERQALTLVRLACACGPVDIDDPAPALTVMLPDED